jgi:large subunit ribosomal protein L16
VTVWAVGDAPVATKTETAKTTVVARVVARAPTVPGAVPPTSAGQAAPGADRCPRSRCSDKPAEARPPRRRGQARRQARSQGARAGRPAPPKERTTCCNPARRKYRKEQKGRNTGVATRGANVSFGDFGLKATERGRITARQIEAARRAISRHIKRGGRIFIRIFPDKPISQKPAEVRMGNGKGNPEYYVAEIVPGKVLYEINGVPEQLAREAFTLAAAKLPLSCTFVARQVGA